MTISVGDRIPEAQLIRLGDTGPEQIEIAERLSGRRVVLVGMPGAYTDTCTEAHIPSLIRNADALRAKGVDEIIVFAVNDSHVMASWGRTTGATDAGITMLSDWDATLTKGLGLNFTAPPVGFIDRCTRVAMIVNNGIVEVLQMEEQRGVCSMTSGETLLAEA